MPNFLTELKRRNVFRVGVAYTVVAWVIAQALDLAVDSFGAPDWVMKVALIVLLAGLPVALILSWAFELTPEGVVKTADVPESQSITPRTGRTLNRITTVALILVLAFVAWDKLWPDAEQTQTAVTERSVAVLPFADLSELQDQEWFADGLTEEILNALARLPELQVTARTSSFEFKNTNTDISVIADSLGVAHVVEGSVRRIGENLRVTAQLIRAADGFHLWSDTYDSSSADLFVVQQDVAENIAATLDVILDDDKRNRMFAAGTRNVAAFEAFSKGRALFRKAHLREAGTPVSLADANEFLDRAMELDPGFAKPAILHADRYAHRLIDGSSKLVGDSDALDPETAYRLLNRDLEVAVTHAPDPVSRVIAELNREFFAPQWHRMPGLISQLKELVKSENTLPLETVWLEEILLVAGEVELAAVFANNRIRTDPLNSSSWMDLVDNWIRRGDYDAAAEVLGEARRKVGDVIRFREAELTMSLLRNDNATAIELLQNDDDLSDAFLYFRPLLAALQGDNELALQLAGEIENASDWPNLTLVGLYAEMGDQTRLRALVKRIDKISIGPAILSIDLALNGGLMRFDLDDTPNLKKRLEEAQIDLALFKSIEQQPSVTADEVLDLAEDVGRWLSGIAVHGPSGVTWPDDALKPDVSGYDLASGVAGKVAYFVALYQATGNEDYLDMARGGADYLVHVLNDPSSFAENPRKASLYTGVSGIGVALIHVQEHAPDPKYEQAMEQVVNQLAEWGISDSDGLHWSDEFNDLIYGEAGTTLFLSYVAERTGDDRALEMAKQGAQFLLSQAQESEAGSYWLFRRSKPFNLPNFSHGTAGVAYVLATVSMLTDDTVFRAGAQAGFDYIKSIAEIEDGRLRIPYGWGSESWDGLYEFGWAHGLVGTTSFFKRLQQAGIDATVAAQFESMSRDTILNIGLPNTPAEPFSEPSTPLDMRFGRAGVLSLLSRWSASETDSKKVDTLRDDLWRHIKSAAVIENDGAYWLVDAPAFMGGGRTAYTGLFHGAAGIGLAVLSLHASVEGGASYHKAPDDPFAWP